MTINSATPQDTFDHIMGAGAMSFDWWKSCHALNFKADDPDVPDDWQVEVSVDNGEGREAAKVIDHKTIMKTARHVLDHKGKLAVEGKPYRAWSEALEHQCQALVFNADDADFDACSADELLQLAVLDEVVYG